MSSAPKLFISYAQKDKRWLDEFLTHLKPLVLQKKIAQWTDREILPGSVWQEEITKALRESHIAVLLVTPAFLASEFIREKELPEALKMQVIWVAVEPSLYTHTPLARLQCANDPKRPLAGLGRYARDTAWVNICEKVLAVAASLPAPKEKESASLPRGSDTKFNPRDGAEMVRIPAGAFAMGDADLSDNPLRTVMLDTYWIYKTPVTVAQYRRFCSDTNRLMPDAPSWGWKDDHPIVNVSWEDAQAYCVWTGMFLPTGAQWEKAARGTDGRKYPWGEEWDAHKCHCSKNTYGDAKETVAVGRYPQGASPYGMLDMAGNVWEWCKEIYDSEEVYLVLRGGSWSGYNPGNFRAARRGIVQPVDRYDGVGFRCVSRADSD